MATIGDRLIAPEAGWRRYDDSYSLIIYEGISTVSNSAFYNGTCKYTDSANSTKVKFTFYGTRIRIISSTSTAYSTNPNLIIIDDITESYTQRAGSVGHQIIVYEKVGLPLGYHNVVISPPNGIPFGIDAVDIDDTGELRNPYNKFLLKENNNIMVSVTPTSQSNTTAVPAMTSNTLPSGVVSASTVVSSNHPFLAFDGQLKANGWIADSKENQWLRYDFPTEKMIGQYSLTMLYSQISSSPKKWRFEALNEYTGEWDILDQRDDMKFTLNVKQIFDIPFDSISFYKSYRIFIISNDGNANYINVGEMELFELTKGSITTIPTYSEGDFNKYGISKNTTIDLGGLIYSRKTVKRDSDVLNSRKVFRYSVDMSEMPIKKVSIT